MTTTQLQEFIHATPFQPFLIRMADGREYRVPHRDFIAHPPNSRIAVVFRDDETAVHIDLLLMTSLESLPAGSSAPQGDGQGA